MQYTYPHTIENGGTEEITFSQPVKEGNTDYVLAEGLVQPGGGPPMHLHYKQDETITVVKGKMATQVLGEPTVYHAEGTSVTFKAGVAHKFWNAGKEPMVTKGIVTPANNLVYFLTEIYRSTKENGGKRPGTFDAAYLSTRYKSEFAMFDLPWFVKNVIFPVSLFFGKIAGKHKKFKDGPEPL